MSSNPITWKYDDLYRLTGQQKSLQVCTYTLDGVGNLKTMWEGGNFPKTFTFNAADRLVTMMEGANLTTYSYTGYGALASEALGKGTTAYSYNGQDQLTGVTAPDGTRSTYTFDGDGMRRAAQEGNVQPTTFVWDGSDYLLLNEPTGNRVVLTLESEIVACGTRDLLTDPLGSLVREIASGASLGSLVEMYPYGTLVKDTGAATTPFVFVAAYGYYTDSASRDYVRARELMKSIGRWLQVDPLWPEEMAYGYVRGSVINAKDPSGLQDPWQKYQQDMNRGVRDLVEGAIKKCQWRAECGRCLNALYHKYRDIYPGETGKGNALRHCVGACAARRQCGKVCAWSIYLHEWNFWTEDSSNDRHNNREGFGVGDSALTCYQGCIKLWDAGLLAPPAGGGPGAGSGGGPVVGPGPGRSGGNQVRGGTNPIWD